MQKIILKATAIDAKQRFQTADEMRRALATKKAKAETVRDFVAASRFPHRKNMEKGDCLSGICLLGNLQYWQYRRVQQKYCDHAAGSFVFGHLSLASNGCADQLRLMESKNLSVFQNACGSKNYLELVLSLVFFVGGYAIENYLRVDVMHIVGK